MAPADAAAPVDAPRANAPAPVGGTPLGALVVEAYRPVMSMVMDMAEPAPPEGTFMATWAVRSLPRMVALRSSTPWAESSTA